MQDLRLSLNLAALFHGIFNDGIRFQPRRVKHGFSVLLERLTPRPVTLLPVLIFREESNGRS